MQLSQISLALTRLGGVPFGPATLFANGEQGAWYDPSDLTTLFQDSAGTTPVTAVEQPVGRMLDKSGRGNHAYQSTSTSRPVLRARYNLLTFSEQFDNAVWTRGSLTVSDNTTATTDPLGGNTADKLQETAANAEHYILQSLTASATQYTATVYLKAAERTWASVYLTTSALASTWFNLAADGTGGVGTVASGVTATSQYIGNGWYRCSITRTLTAASWSLVINPALGDGISVVYAGTLNSGIYAWGAQLIVTNSLPSNTYQRIAAATVYDTTGFLPYLAFDGTDDSLLTNSVNFATVTSDGQARRNVLNNPTQFDVSTVWIVSNTTVSANATTSPDGGTTADLVYPATSGTNRSIYEAATVVTSTTYTNSIYVKYSNIAWINLSSVQGSSARSAWFNVQTGQKGTVAGGVTADISSVGNGWYRCSVTDTSSGVTGYLQVIFASADNSTSVTANGTDGVFLWGAQLEAGSITAFQNIGTDKMTVWAGVRKLSDAATFGVIGELSSATSTNAGAFVMTAPAGSASTYYFATRGSINGSAVTSPANYAAPITNVLTGVADIAADQNLLRINGTQVGSDVTDQGTGNYGNYPIYIGRRNNATLPFNGWLTSLIIRGAQSTASQISSTETWVAQKTGVTL